MNKMSNINGYVIFLIAKVIKYFLIASAKNCQYFQNSPNVKTNAHKMLKFRDLSKPRILIPVKINPYKV